MWTGCSIRYSSWNFSCSSYSGMSLVIWDLTASASYNFKSVSVKDPLQADYTSSCCQKCHWNFKGKNRAATISLGNINSWWTPKFWTGPVRPVSGRSLLLEVWAQRSSLLQRAHSPKLVVFQLLQFVDANLHHTVTVTTCAFLNFIQVHLVKVEWVAEKLKWYRDKHNIKKWSLNRLSN
jgi:hypothetical protein